MSSCGSSGDDFLGWCLRQVQKDLNQGKHVDWATEEEIAARQAELERAVREEVKTITAQQQGGQSNPIMVGSVQSQYNISLNLSGPSTSLEYQRMLSTISEPYRITNQFIEDFRVLQIQLEVLELENQTLRRVIGDMKKQP